ncbi:DUF218 domain-containing protein [Mucilaginibacter frigoritolerans]|uniref:DUF218 domain-containing protein n=1 Tax=Mucilaginibacter frigoritolerans TaxID=652788 RepID=A0A562UFL7_9SPHI|nr:YdcF family protein [Mucilaginibacter frigoritolerans]TWJ04588.1 DUF218 domain-containing protein [Mucilaginibacter frigoritolerans]
MKCLFVLLLAVFCAINVYAQKSQSGYQPIGNGSVQAKNFYLLTLLEHNDKIRLVLEHDSVLSIMAVKQNEAIARCLAVCTTYKCITDTLKLSSEAINKVSTRLAYLYRNSADLQKLVKNELIPSNCYRQDSAYEAVTQLTKAWEQDAKDINHTIDVYANGLPPKYPAIDSISFNVNSPGYINVVKQTTAKILGEEHKSRLFFMPGMTAALAFLNVNGRNNAGDYEPMELTVNKAALQKAKSIVWANYNYTVLLVPGEGPDSSNTPISNSSKNRCRIAAAVYHQSKSAPFIMVSGGKVHPYKTPFCEAVEMKRFLIDSLQIPDSSIILEPHARHTTTNMRNGVRLLIQYNFPLLMPALVVSDSSQSAYISGMKQRCINELGDVPYQLGKRISVNSQEFYAVPVAGQINLTEPLDP